ncbi:MAG TPA: hypothetical protein VFF27_05730 [Bacteroidia bacterium]|jgi:WD40 repeat protein|nr:hypothetical protein [Bacteroidia bacterium]
MIRFSIMDKLRVSSIKWQFISVIFLLFSCQTATKPNFETEKQALLDLDEQARKNHFSKNAKAMSENFSSDFISINRGIISTPTKQESFQRFDNYFKRVEFIKWDNNKPPIIRFSDDASVAYVSVDKTVILKTKNEQQREILDTTYFAWLSVYKKINGKWILDCISSTNK